MYIVNLNKSSGRYYECGKIVAKYLAKQGIPIISRLNGRYFFAKTINLQNCLNKMPLYLKFMIKVGVICG